MLNLVLGFLMDILILWGTAMGAAMTAVSVATKGEVTMPPAAVTLFALITAVVQAGRRWDSKMSASPIKPEAVLLRTPAQLEAQGKARETEAARVAEEVVKRILVTAPAAPPIPPPSPFAQSPKAAPPPGSVL